MKRIGIYVERHRAWGRQICEGVCAFAQAHDDWSLAMLEREDFASPTRLSAFDGFIARVPDVTVAQALAHTRRPVADLTCEAASEGRFIRAVWQDNAAVGKLAARHFIEHRFTRFAFCGYADRRFSDERRDAFARCLRLNRFETAVYECPPTATRAYDTATAQHERLSSAPDARQLVRWLQSLPKPVAVFCANDLRGQQVIFACAEAGIAVPAEVAVLGLDNDTLVCNFVTPTLSSIDPDATALGLSAARALALGLDGLRTPPRQSLVPPRELVTRASTETFPVDPPWLSDALVFIRRNINRRLSAADVYAAVHRSHTRVDAAFRERLGTTVQAEIRRVALDEARRLLATTGLSVADVARRAGFASPQYFCNVFTAAFGQPPSTVPRGTPRPPRASARTADGPKAPGT